MKKSLFFMVVALMTLTAANAQVKLGLGVGYAIPSGDVADLQMAVFLHILNLDMA